MILDVDIGNTRVKWLLRGASGKPVERGVFNQDALPEPIFSFDVAIERVRIASVDGSVASQITTFCQQRWHIEPEIATVCDGVGGLVCGYQQPKKLGIDRWLAVLAGWSECRGSFLVADAGSALTLDLVDDSGVHHGGYIVPGYEMMKTALGFQTWGVRVEKNLRPTLALGRETSAAVQHGCLGAITGLVELTARRYAVNTILLTGGDAELIAGSLDVGTVNIKQNRDLVLDGLAIALP